MGLPIRISDIGGTGSLHWDGTDFGLHGLQFKNMLDSDTGVAGDGSTADASDIQAVFNDESIEAFYFPPATYRIDQRILIFDGPSNRTNPNMIVVLHPNAIFDTSQDEVDSDMIQVQSMGEADNLGVFVWSGGTYNMAGMPNDAGGQIMREYGFRQPGTSEVHDAIRVNNCYFSRVRIEDMRIFTKQDAHLYDPRDPKRQHWLGDYTRGYRSGGGTGIAVNSGPGIVEILNNMIVGTVDSAIYPSGQGNTRTTPATAMRIHGNRFFWCSAGTNIKASATAVVTNEYYYGTWRGPNIGIQPTTTGGVGGKYVFFGDIQGFKVGDTECQMGEHVVFDGLSMRECGEFDFDDSLFGCHFRWDAQPVNGDRLQDITVNAVDLLQGTDVTCGADLNAWADSVRDTINAGRLTSGWVCTYYVETGTPDTYHFGFTSIASITGDRWGDQPTFNVDDGAGGAEAGTYVLPNWNDDGNNKVGYIYSDNGLLLGVSISGSQKCEFRNISLHRSELYQADRPDVRMEATRIYGIDDANTPSDVGDLPCEDLLIDGLYLLGDIELGGEVSIAGVANPDRTIYRNIVWGEGADLQAPTLLGAGSFCDYSSEKRRSKLAADEDRTSTTTLDGTTETALSLPVRAVAEYRIYGQLFMTGGTVGDARFGWTTPGTPTGYYNIHGPVGASGATGATRHEARLWTENQTGFGLQADPLESLFTIEGTFSTTADGNLILQFAQDVSDATTCTMLAGSWIALERIG